MASVYLCRWKMSKYDNDCKKVTEELQKRIKDVTEANARFVLTAVKQLKTTAKLLMTNTPTKPDVVYRHGHHPSIEGEAPAVDMGGLRASVKHDVEQEGETVKGNVGSVLQNPPYGAYLEFGTSKMKPRPWLSQAVIHDETLIYEMYHAIVGEAIGGK